MTSKLTCIVILVIYFQFCLAQNTPSFLQFQLKDQISQEPIPYAHISSKGKLITISNYAGYLSIHIGHNLDSITISSVGYETHAVQIDRSKTTGENQIIYISPSSNKLNEVIITPQSLKTLIAEIYEQIPNKYCSEPHILVGKYQEYYKDTSNNIIAQMDFEIEVYKKGYTTKNIRGEIAVKKYNRNLKDTFDINHIISAGPHIPHRFDFVMKRDGFINPHKNSGYAYTFLQEIKYNNRKVEVISFQPKKGSLLGVSFFWKTLFRPSRKSIY